MKDADPNKASLHPPKGELSGHLDYHNIPRPLDEDNEFFHITCHIDKALKLRIERGEFVDLGEACPKG